MARNETLLQTCKERMQTQSKLELYRDYNEYLDGDQVRDFLNYVENQINQGNLLEPASYLYDYFTSEQDSDWFNDYESEQFHEMYMRPFEEKFGEEEWFDYSEANEILRDLMYDMDMYDANIDHFDTSYHFYLLTDPELTYELYDEGTPLVEFKHKYLKSLQRSQGRTKNSKSMVDLLYSGGYNGEGICIMLNISLFDMVNIMLSKRLTVRKGSQIYMFNPYIGTGGDTVELTSNWTFKFNLKEVRPGCDDARRGPRGYTPDEVYGWYHTAFDNNKVLSHY